MEEIKKPKKLTRENKIALIGVGALAIFIVAMFCIILQDPKKKVQKVFEKSFNEANMLKGDPMEETFHIASPIDAIPSRGGSLHVDANLSTWKGELHEGGYQYSYDIQGDVKKKLLAGNLSIIDGAISETPLSVDYFGDPKKIYLTLTDILDGYLTVDTKEFLDYYKLPNTEGFWDKTKVERSGSAKFTYDDKEVKPLSAYDLKVSQKYLEDVGGHFDGDLKITALLDDDYVRQLRIQYVEEPEMEGAIDLPLKIDVTISFPSKKNLFDSVNWNLKITASGISIKLDGSYARKMTDTGFEYYIHNQANVMGQQIDSVAGLRYFTKNHRLVLNGNISGGKELNAAYNLDAEFNVEKGKKIDLKNGKIKVTWLGKTFLEGTWNLTLDTEVPEVPVVDSKKDTMDLYGDNVYEGASDSDAGGNNHSYITVNDFVESHVNKDNLAEVYLQLSKVVQFLQVEHK